MGFTKLFSSLVSSTIWDEDDKTRIVWITMLALAEFDGAVMASVPGLAHQARVARKACEAALVKLSAPDFDSRTKYYDGRRIEEIEGGWRILNHTFYQNLWSREERNARQAAYMRKRRAGDAVVLHETSIPKPPETESPLESTMCPKVADVGHSNTNTYSNTNNKSKSKNTSAAPQPDTALVYSAYPRPIGKAAAIKAIEKASKRLQQGEMDGKPMTRGDAMQLLMVRAGLFARSPQGQRGQYTPYPASWFNAARYLDDESQWNIEEHSNGQTKAEQTRDANLDARNEARARIMASGRANGAGTSVRQTHDT